MVVILALLPSAALSVPNFVTYSGRLADGTGWNQSATVTITAAVYSCECAPSAVCTHKCSGDEATPIYEGKFIDVPLVDGYFTVQLGMCNAAGLCTSDPALATFPSELPPLAWLGLAVGSGAEIYPRVVIGSVPYALRAGEVAPTGGQSVVKAMKLALGYSDDPDSPKYLSDEGYLSYHRGDCPLGYTRDHTGTNAQYVVCKKGLDEMVKVGDFWIDRYEMSLWETPECGGALFGQSTTDAHDSGFGRNGSDVQKLLYGCSVGSIGPSRWLTWFQSQRACEASGKHLCSNAEWQVAAYGTPDPHSSDPGGDLEACNIWPDSKPKDATWAIAKATIMTGTASACISHVGAYDMVGNLWEWTSDWWGQGPDNINGAQAPNGEFYGDGYWNLVNALQNGSYSPESPAFSSAALRGGNWYREDLAGVYSIYLAHGPSYWTYSVGARCCIR